MKINVFLSFNFLVGFADGFGSEEFFERCMQQYGLSPAKVAHIRRERENALIEKSRRDAFAAQHWRLSSAVSSE